MTAPATHLHHTSAFIAEARPAMRNGASRRLQARQRMYVQRRIGLVLLTVVVVAFASFLIVGNGGAHADLDPSTPVQTYRVLPGDTLWSIAGELSYPGDRRDAIAILSAANGSGDVVAGEDLIIPASLGSIR